jgi:hypothetical protein
MSLNTLFTTEASAYLDGSTKAAANLVFASGTNTPSSPIGDVSSITFQMGGNSMWLTPDQISALYDILKNWNNLPS